ncbi:hypothetical protein UA08_02389 [Talaromyces atroroseus]|uniref:Endoglucanase n=1 Tax=Talaromyces atroroseus TaxID=1441469 RepID=A0A225B890_TALAT|nr:hypothetical protein UA08_02389 [Talaromyces atroroseus]OKL62157.1 hypothetical protein UA08_02389 [Talaromyces atroroseus]
MIMKAAVSLLAIRLASAHIEMNWPYPLRSKYDPDTPTSLIDYSMTDPLKSDGSNFPCKGYISNTPWRSVTSYMAGQKYNISLAGSATHGGGSCQLSLSYDNGTSFHVIESMEGGCPLESSYDFNMPSDVANGDALFAWTWFNYEGNREMYMNCADVTISGGQGTADSFESAYPEIFVANVGNGCQTIEMQETVFAHPGNQVIYGSGVTSSSPPSPSCA